MLSFRTTALSLGFVKSRSSFTARPSPMEWSLIFLCLHQGPLRWNGHWFSYVYIKALSNGMVIDFLMFTARPSPMEWSLFSSLRQGPLQWNGRWYPYVYIKDLSDGMVIDFFVTAKPSPMEWSLFSFHIMTLFTELVIGPVWVGFCSSSSSLKFRQNWCLYLYLSFTAIIWKCYIFILSNKI